MSGLYGYLEGIIILGVAGYFYWRQRQQTIYTRSLDQASGIDHPFLVPLYTQQASVTVLSSGTLGTFPYRLSYVKPATIKLEPSPLGLINNSRLNVVEAAYTTYHNTHLTDRVILLVDLPTKAPHIVSLTYHQKDLEDQVRQMVAGAGLARVTLEGDFSEYFNLYTEQNKELELLQVLDPTAMVQLIDYCKEYDWELVGNQLTVIQPDEKGTNTDGTGLTQDATAFATKILPTLLRMSNDNPVAQT